MFVERSLEYRRLKLLHPKSRPHHVRMMLCGILLDITIITLLVVIFANGATRH